MHELTGKITNGSYLSFSPTGKPLLMLEINERQSALKMVDELKDAERVAIKIGKFKQRRSLDANAYCWTLIGKIAEKTNARVEDVYRAALKEIGGNYDIVCVQDKAVESLCHSWQRNGIGWQTDTMPSKIEGCTNVILYYGSSTYDTQAMSRLISVIQQDCEALGIEVRSQEELDSLLNSWGG